MVQATCLQCRTMPCLLVFCYHGGQAASAGKLRLASVLSPQGAGDVDQKRKDADDKSTGKTRERKPSWLKRKEAIEANYVQNGQLRDRDVKVRVHEVPKTTYRGHPCTGRTWNQNIANGGLAPRYVPFLPKCHLYTIHIYHGHPLLKILKVSVYRGLRQRRKPSAWFGHRCPTKPCF